MNEWMNDGVDGWMNGSLGDIVVYVIVRSHLDWQWICIDVEDGQREEKAAVFKASQTAQSLGTGVEESQRVGTRQPPAARGRHR